MQGDRRSRRWASAQVRQALGGLRSLRVLRGNRLPVLQEERYCSSVPAELHPWHQPVERRCLAVELRRAGRPPYAPRGLGGRQVRWHRRELREAGLLQGLRPPVLHEERVLRAVQDEVRQPLGVRQGRHAHAQGAAATATAGAVGPMDSLGLCQRWGQLSARQLLPQTRHAVLPEGRQFRSVQAGVHSRSRLQRSGFHALVLHQIGPSGSGS